MILTFSSACYRELDFAWIHALNPQNSALTREARLIDVVKSNRINALNSAMRKQLLTEGNVDFGEFTPLESRMEKVHEPHHGLNCIGVSGLCSACYPTEGVFIPDRSNIDCEWVGRGEMQSWAATTTTRTTSTTRTSTLNRNIGWIKLSIVPRECLDNLKSLSSGGITHSAHIDQNSWRLLESPIWE